MNEVRETFYKFENIKVDRFGARLGLISSRGNGTCSLSNGSIKAFPE